MLLATVWGTTWRMLEIERATEEREVRSATQQLTNVYAVLMLRALDQIDLAIAVVRLACEYRPPAQALTELQESILVPSSLLFSIMVIDDQGRVVATNKETVDKDQSRSPYFATFRDQKKIGDFLYAAQDSTSSTNRMIFARRMGRGDGSFAGVVTLAVDTDYLTSWYETSRIGKRGVIGLATNAGQLIVTRTGDRVIWGDRHAAGSESRIGLDQATTDLVVNPWDGERRFIMTERLVRYPFATFVGLSEKEQFQEFDQHCRAQLVKAMLASAVLCLFGVIFWRTGLAQARNRKAQETYHAASDASLDANLVLHAVTDSKGTIHDFVIASANRQAFELTGLSSQDLVGKKLGDFVPELRPSDLFQVLSQAVKTNTLTQHEWENKDPRIKSNWLSAQVVPAPDGVVAIVRDISERRRSEDELVNRNVELTSLNRDLSALNQELTHAHEQLVQSEKLASIGLLAAGVAHEINNPIGFVLSNIGTLGDYTGEILLLLEEYQKMETLLVDAADRQRLADCRERAELDYLKKDIPVLLRETKEGISRVRKIVEDLKSFSHVDSQNEWKLTDLHQGIDSTLNIVNNELKYVADVVKAYGDLPAVECLPSEINQVVLNLLVNAGHAMGAKRGTITVRTGATDEWAWIEVDDTGSGIAPENLARIFDPFFTTKPVGKGTGLGLSLSYGIVKKHGGEIGVRSELGVGTAFKISLPLGRRHAIEEISPIATAKS